MWYIFDTNFELKGLMGEITSIEINHLFFECDNLTFEAPFTPELYASLQLGYILHRGGQKTAYRINSLEIKEDENLIWGSALGIEGILDQRVIETPINMTEDPRGLIYQLIDKHLINPVDPSRKINNLYMLLGDMENIQTEDFSYYGETLYSVITELCKRKKYGFFLQYVPKEKKMWFSLGQGIDRTSLQSENKPIIWRSNWGDTREEMLSISQKDYKNIIYSLSGDETPLREIVSSGSGSGWDRFESFIQSSDITANLKDENETPLTEAQLRLLLKNKGNLELLNKRKLNEFTFTLNQDIQEIFGIDYNVGDIVSVVHQNYGIVKHLQITAVKETIISDQSQFEITFDEQ